jgi:hypothetical protein
MDQIVKEKWITALESGEYKQCTGQLSHDGGYCCLGVLTDLYLKETGGEWDMNDILRDDGGLGSKVREWAGISEVGPEVSIGLKYVPLVNMNDIDHRSFSYIADALRNGDVR